MPNWCYTSVSINTKSHNLFNTWLDKGQEESDFKRNWLGSIIKYSGIGNPDSGDCPRCRGTIENIDTDDNSVIFNTETAWSPMLKGLKMVADKYAPGSEIIYSAEECGMEIYFTNDPSEVGKIYVDNWTDKGDYIESCDDYDESEVREALKDALPGMDVKNMPIDSINSALCEKGIDIRIHKWEEVSIEDLE